MHFVPVFFGTTTMPAHQGVGSSTSKITRLSIDSILSNSCFICSGNGTLRGVKIVNGLAPAFNLIVYSFPKLSRP